MCVSLYFYNFIRPINRQSLTGAFNNKKNSISYFPTPSILQTYYSAKEFLNSKVTSKNGNFPDGFTDIATIKSAPVHQHKLLNLQCPPLQ